MTELRDLVPVPSPGNDVDLYAVFEAAHDTLGLDVAGMRTCQQNLVFHGEGDVAAHTALVLARVVEDPTWCALDEETRAEVFVTALLHDAAKPRCTKLEDGVWRAPGHAHRGEKLAREMLWRASVSWDVRERIAHAIRFHLQPFHLLERAHPQRAVLTIAESVAPRNLAILARGDALGRVCGDQSSLLDAVTYFEETARDLHCFTGPYSFASDFSRFTYFASDVEARRDPAYHAYDGDSFDVTVSSGLPGSGKTTWRAQHYEGPVISLDDIRSELGVRHGDSQGSVLALAKERARVLLRTKTSFLWDATNLSRATRDVVISLFSQYGASITLVAFEAATATLATRNRRRPDARRLPSGVLDAMVARWEFPTRTECSVLRVTES